jgi:hypothetical protein
MKNEELLKQHHAGSFLVQVDFHTRGNFCELCNERLTVADSGVSKGGSFMSSGACTRLA